MKFHENASIYLKQFRSILFVFLESTGKSLESHCSLEKVFCCKLYLLLYIILVSRSKTWFHRLCIFFLFLCDNQNCDHNENRTVGYELFDLKKKCYISNLKLTFRPPLSLRRSAAIVVAANTTKIAKIIA